MLSFLQVDFNPLLSKRTRYYYRISFKVVNEEHPSLLRSPHTCGDGAISSIPGRLAPNDLCYRAYARITHGNNVCVGIISQG